MNSTTKLIGWAIVSVGLVGCGGRLQEQSSDQQWSTFDSSGVQIVRNMPSSFLPHCVVADSAQSMVDPKEVLGRIVGGKLLSTNTIVLLDNSEHQLRYFSATGALQHAVGRHGRGPGEFVSPDWIDVTAGDTVLVWDSAVKRLSYFDSNGTLLTTETVSIGISNVRGRFYDGSLAIVSPAVVHFTGTGEVNRWPMSLRRLNVTSSHEQALVTLPGPQTVDAPGGPYRLPFGATSLFVTRDSALVVVDGQYSVITDYGLDGEPYRIIQWRAQRRSTSNEERSRYVQTMTLRPGQQRPERFSDQHPKVDALLVDVLGWIWTREPSTPAGTKDVWRVFDSSGKEKCLAAMPNGLLVYAIKQDHLLGKLESETGEESVGLFKINRHASSIPVKATARR